MKFRKIECFIAAIEEESFEKAAEKCHISQTAFSRQIISLEGDIGVRLFDRKHYRAKPTAAGMFFYENSKRILADYQCIVDRTKKLEPKYESVLKIGLTGPVELNYLPPIIRKFHERYPYVKTELKKNSFTHFRKEYRREKYNILFGLCNEISDIEDFEKVDLFQMHPCVITSTQHRLVLKDELYCKELENEDFIIFSKHFGEHHYEASIKFFQKAGFTPKIVMEVDTFEELLLQVSVDKGIAIVSKEVLKGYDQVHSISLKETNVISKYCIGWNKYSENQTEKMFVEFIKKHLSRKYHLSA